MSQKKESYKTAMEKELLLMTKVGFRGYGTRWKIQGFNLIIHALVLRTSKALDSQLMLMKKICSTLLPD